MLKSIVMMSVVFASQAFAIPTSRLERTLAKFVNFIGDCGDLPDAESRLKRGIAGDKEERQNTSQILMQTFLADSTSSGIRVLRKKDEKIYISASGSPEILGTEVKQEDLKSGCHQKDSTVTCFWDKNKIEKKLKEIKKETNLPDSFVGLMISRTKEK